MFIRTCTVCALLLSTFAGISLAQDSLNIWKLSTPLLFWDETKDLAIDGSLACIAGGRSGLHVIDYANPGAPIETGSLYFGVSVLDVDLQLPYAYLALVEGGIGVVDLSDPTAPVLVYQTNNYPIVEYVAIHGQLMIAGTNSGLLLTYDLSNPTEPELLGTLEEVRIWDAVFWENSLYAATGDGIYFISLETPETPEILGFSPSPFSGGGFMGPGEISIAKRDEFVFVSGLVSDWGEMTWIRSLDVSDPDTLVATALYTAFDNQFLSPRILTVEIVDTLLITSGYGTEFFSISESGLLEPLFYHPQVNLTSIVPVGESLLGLGFQETPGFRMYDISNAPALEFIGSINNEGSISRILMDENFAYLLDNKRSVVLGLDCQDVSNPVHEWTLPVPNEFLSDIQISEDFLFISGYQEADNDGKISIFSIDDPGIPEYQSEIELYGQPVRMVVQDNMLYTGINYSYQQTPSTIEIYSLSDVDFPVFINSFEFTGNKTWPLSVINDYLYVYSFNNLYVYDVRDPFNPESAGMFDGSANRRDYISFESYSDLAYAACSDHPGSLDVFSLASPASPVLTSEIEFQRCYNLNLRNNLMVAACFEDGIRLMDTAEPEEPEAYGYYQSGLRFYAADLYETTVVGSEGFRVSTYTLEEMAVEPHRQIITSEVEICCYPSPFNSGMNIQLPAAADIKSVSILNLLGQTVYRFSASEIIPGSRLRWDSTGKPSGIYYVRIEQGVGTAVTKSVCHIK